MVSMKDIAAACGVSVATVSKSLNGYSDISTETKNLIQMKAKELGYFPNSAARALKTNRTYNIGVVMNDDSGSGLTHEYFANLLQSARDEVEKNGYDITFINRTAGGRKMSYYEHCMYRGVDGVLVACADFQSAEIEELVSCDIPVVTFDHAYAGRPAIISDNRRGMEDLVQHVYDKGHRRIAYIHGEFSQVTNIRIEAFESKMERLGLAVPEEYIREASYHDVESTKAIAMELMALDNPPTCILYPDDFTALAGITYLRKAGYSVPEDISIAGYDGIVLGQVLYPHLTTLAQDTSRMGIEAARCLMEMIDHPEMKRTRHVVIQGQLVEGESVVRCRRSY